MYKYFIDFFFINLMSNFFRLIPDFHFYFHQIRSPSTPYFLSLPIIYHTF